MTEQEFVIHYRVLKAHMYDMSDWFVQEIRELIYDLNQDTKTYRNGGPEPDWQSYADAINEVLREDGMPALFAAANMDIEND